MTDEGHLPNSWAEVACSSLKLGTLAVGMIKPGTMTPSTTLLPTSPRSLAQAHPLQQTQNSPGYM